MKATRERELKLEVGPRFRLPALPGDPLPPRVLTSTYLDTSDHRLASAGVTLRRRVERGAGVWQLKLPRGEARLEIEAAGPAGAPPDELRDLVTAYARGSALVPVAILRSRRRGVRVRDLEGPAAEVVLDDVQVLEQGRVVRRFREVEIEQIGGDDSALDRLAAVLRAAGATAGDFRPKLFRALGLPGPTAEPVASGAGPADRLKAVLGQQLAQIVAHDPGTRLGSDPEDLHQMRVATRRLRAVLRAARPMLDAGWVEPLREELRWLGAALGPVRDLDVMRSAPGRRDRVARALRRAGGPAPAAHARRGPRGSAPAPCWMPSARTATSGSSTPSRTRRGGPRSWMPRSPCRISPPTSSGACAARWRSSARPQPTQELHEVRIKGKRARYAAELAEPLVGRPATRFIKRAKVFQDVLGEHQDAAVAAQRLRDLAGRARSAPAALVAGRLIERERQRRDAARAAFADQWEKLERRGAKAWR